MSAPSARRGRRKDWRGGWHTLLTGPGLQDVPNAVMERTQGDSPFLPAIPEMPPFVL